MIWCSNGQLHLTKINDHFSTILESNNAKGAPQVAIGWNGRIAKRIL